MIAAVELVRKMVTHLNAIVHRAKEVRIAALTVSIFEEVWCSFAIRLADK